MADLATLAEIKGRLELADVDATRDAVLEAWRLAIQERVLDLTGFLLPDDPYFTSIQKVEEQQNVQLGMSRLMKYRPLVPMSTDPTKAVTLRARMLGSSTSDTILGEIRDTWRARVIALASELPSASAWPPTGIGVTAVWRRWQQAIWPTIEYTYLVDPLGSPTNPTPEALNRTVVEWAAFVWAMKPHSGRVRSFSAESVSETYENYPVTTAVPPIVSLLLSRYIRGQGSLIF
jgi:hypothetical protein